MFLDFRFLYSICISVSVTNVTYDYADDITLSVSDICDVMIWVELEIIMD